jgi:hypothetical protein
MAKRDLRAFLRLHIEGAGRGVAGGRIESGRSGIAEERKSGRDVSRPLSPTLMTTVIGIPSLAVFAERGSPRDKIPAYAARK